MHCLKAEALPRMGCLLAKLPVYGTPNWAVAGYMHM
jgi:hypothetical protein